MIIKDSGFTKNWFQAICRYCLGRHKRIRLAVVGSNAHGKSYFLFDVIHAFELQGYKLGPLPAESPYSHWNGYFGSIRKPDGGLPGTERYACRSGNHYGAVLTKDGEKTIDIDFVNIPGEPFKMNVASTEGTPGAEGATNQKSADRILTFYAIKTAIERTGKGVLQVIEWHSKDGSVEYVVEPTPSVLESTGKGELNRQPEGVNPDGSYRLKYQDWNHIFARLRKRQFEPDLTTTKSISGKELIRDFFKYNTDSVMQAIHDAWQSFIFEGIEINAHDFVNDHFDSDFYFFMYCLNATDIVICDKLFDPVGTKVVEKMDGFVYMARQLNNLLDPKYNDNKMPNIYLSFRSADMILDEAKVQDLYHKLSDKGCQNTSNVIYTIFMHQLFETVLNSNNSYKLSLSDILDDFKLPEGCYVLAEESILSQKGLAPLKEHILSRIGNETSGFIQLLMMVVSNKEIKTKLLDKALPIPPHTFFTATPIDADYRFYVPDPHSGNQRFIREDPETHHVSDMNSVGRYLSFGTTEFCQDLLNQHETDIEKSISGELLYELSIKFK